MSRRNKLAFQVKFWTHGTDTLCVPDEPVRRGLPVFSIRTWCEVRCVPVEEDGEYRLFWTCEGELEDLYKYLEFVTKRLKAKANVQSD